MSSHGSGHRSLSALPVVLCAVLLVATSLGAGAQSSFIGLLGLGPSVSTVPNNGDVNPYGMALVQETKGSLIKGDILIRYLIKSNFVMAGWSRPGSAGQYTRFSCVSVIS